MNLLVPTLLSLSPGRIYRLQNTSAGCSLFSFLAGRPLGGHFSPTRQTAVENDPFKDSLRSVTACAQAAFSQMNPDHSGSLNIPKGIYLGKGLNGPVYSDSMESIPILDPIVAMKSSFADSELSNISSALRSVQPRYNSPSVLSDYLVRKLYEGIKRAVPSMSKERALPLVCELGGGTVRRQRFLGITANSALSFTVDFQFATPPVLSDQAVVALSKAILKFKPSMAMAQLRDQVACLGSGSIRGDRFKSLLEASGLWNPQTSVAQQCSVAMRDATKIQYTPSLSVNYNKRLSNGEGCAVCGLKEHRGVDIHVFGECDHVYGVKNSPITRLLCRNCHNQTITSYNQRGTYQGQYTWPLVTVPDASHDLSKINMIPEGARLLGGLKRKSETLIKGALAPATIDSYVPMRGRSRDILRLGRHVKIDRCVECGISEHRKISVASVLELHHVDGDHNNDTLTNLMALCGNCHAIKHRRPMSEKAIPNTPLNWDDLMYHFENRTIEVMPRLVYYTVNSSRCPETRVKLGEIFGYKPHRIARLFTNYLPQLNEKAVAKKGKIVAVPNGWNASSVMELLKEAFDEGVFSGNYVFKIEV